MFSLINERIYLLSIPVSPSYLELCYEKVLRLSLVHLDSEIIDLSSHVYLLVYHFNSQFQLLQMNWVLSIFVGLLFICYSAFVADGSPF